MSVAVAVSRLQYLHEKQENDSAWKTLGCGPRCRAFFARVVDRAYPERIVQHDIEHHESYGANVLAASPVSRVRGVVRTGGLSINGDTCEVVVDGKTVHLTPTEFAILGVLTARMGTVVPQRDMLRTVWGAEYALDQDGAHMLRIHVSRLRTKLGAARGLIQTVPHLGYMLLREPAPSGVTEADILRAPVQQAAATLDWIEGRQGPLLETGYARIELTVADVRALARLLNVDTTDEQ